MLQIPQHVAGKIPVFIRMDASILQSSNKRKAFLAVLKNGKREMCRGRKISFTMLTILDNIKGKCISCHFTVWLHIAHCILLVHICRGRYMLKRKKKIIIRNYEQLCVLYNIWSTGIKNVPFFLTCKIVYRHISYSNPVNDKINLKSEVLGVS